jgi:hypothetical protein
MSYKSCDTLYLSSKEKIGKFFKTLINQSINGLTRFEQKKNI